MKKKLIGFDFETTSAIPQTTRVVQFCAIEFDPEPQVLVNTLTDPGIPISLSASKIHGIYNDQVKGKESDTDVVGRFADYLEEQAEEFEVTLCGHNILAFDLPILKRLASRPGLTVGTLDTYHAAARIWPLAPSHRLSELCQWLDISKDSQAGAHDAAFDVIMVGDLINALCEKAGGEWMDLEKQMRTPRFLEVCTYKKYRGRKWGRPLPDEPENLYVPEGYVQWMRKTFTHMSPDLKYTLDVAYPRRPR